MVPTPTRRRVPCAVSSLLFTMLLAAQAQAQPSTPTRPDPLDPKASVPAVRYDSAFAQFRRLGHEKPVPWRDANDAVARIGGWRAYAREVHQPEPATQAKPVPSSQLPTPTQAPASAPAAQPMPPGHSGHKH